ncbi:MAG: CRISPR-associated protein Cas4 [Clostridiales bacterium]|nr:CRISPR-associated protein Cas4 [Clostridiales bacterium]
MSPEEYLPISGLQHYAFCPRQWALIHLEEQWQENALTAEGRALHDAAHDANFTESRAGLVIARSLWLSSARLGLVGVSDVVEFHADAAGIPLPGRRGAHRPYPIEYKRGKPKAGNYDRLQLCAQALCLEEMTGCAIPEGALYYAAIRRREAVTLDEELRREVQDCTQAMHEAYRSGRTPAAQPRPVCKNCSLLDRCLPGLSGSAQRYNERTIQTMLDEEG